MSGREVSAKVYDADGVKIRAGETLFHIRSGDSVIARQLMAPDKFEDTDFARHFASEYTHRAPVIAADGKPLLAGEVVYEVKTGDMFEVMGVYDGTADPDFPEHAVECRKVGDVDGYMRHMFKPGQLAHELPIGREAVENADGRFSVRALDRREQADADAIRSAASDLLASIEGKCPPSRARSLAITKLEECVMWAVRSIARGSGAR